MARVARRGADESVEPVRDEDGRVDVDASMRVLRMPCRQRLLFSLLPGGRRMLRHTDDVLRRELEAEAAAR